MDTGELGGEIRGREAEKETEREAEERQQCVTTAVFAWDYPSAQHTVKSLSFDILECLHKCILECRKFCDSSQAIRPRGFTGKKKSLTTTGYRGGRGSEEEPIMRSRVQRLTLRN